MLERKLVRVDVIPNSTWTEKRLVELGLKNGVVFPGCTSVDEAMRLSKKKILEVLYEQREWEEFQDPVAESTDQRSAVAQMAPLAEEYFFAARVTYNGLSPMASLFFEGKPLIFIKGQEYRIPAAKRDLLNQIRKTRGFSVEYEDAEPIDPVLLMMREVTEFNRGNQFGQDDDNDFFGL